MPNSPECPVCQIAPCEKPTCRYVMALEARSPVVAPAVTGLTCPPWCGTAGPEDCADKYHVGCWTLLASNGDWHYCSRACKDAGRSLIPAPTPSRQEPPSGKTSPGVGMPASLYLQEFGQLIRDTFGEIPYHVGSSMAGSGRPTWRDVDVRLLLSDDRYAAGGYGDPANPHSNAKWVAMVKAFSLLGRQMTGLPIDFQIQQVTDANARYGSDKPEHHRSALFTVRERVTSPSQEPPSVVADVPAGFVLAEGWTTFKGGGEECTHRGSLGDWDCEERAVVFECVDALAAAAGAVVAAPIAIAPPIEVPAGPDSFGGGDEGSHLDNSAHLALKNMLAATTDAGMAVSIFAGGLADKLRAAETALDAANRSLEQSKEAYRMVDTERNAATREIEALRADRDGHADDARSLQGRLNRVNEGAKELKAEIEVLRAQRDEAIESMRQAWAKLESTEREWRKALSERDAANKASFVFDDARRLALEELIEAKRRIEDMELETCGGRRCIAQDEKTIADLRVQMAARDARIAGLEASAADLVAQIRTLTDAASPRKVER